MMDDEKKDDDDVVVDNIHPQQPASYQNNKSTKEDVDEAAISPRRSTRSRQRIDAETSSTSCEDVMSNHVAPGEEKANNTRRNNKVVFLLLHTTLAFLFLCLCAVYTLQDVHDSFFVPIVERARRTDQDLREEYTYYDRQCTAVDLTVHHHAPNAGTPLILDYNHNHIQQHHTNQTNNNNNNNNNNNTQKDIPSGVDIVMEHGAVLLPELLHPRTVQELRQFVVAKNNQVRGTDAEIPISEARGRISYGIDATEDERVIRALKEIHSHAVLAKTLQDLLGPNPALTEITAITASFGCEDQVWHPDTKPDGNAVKWAQTYAHSYSLFIPLQDTSGEMGATDLCPGTHYCANDDLHEICEAHKIGLHEILPTASSNATTSTRRRQRQRWRAGDAALLNQHVWHRGTAHTDPRAQDRVMFIVSFISRPNDPRQLSRGTYFHMKWNMWGHTWQDLGDAGTSMAWPWNILRCWHIWKPKDRAWGYDLVTSAALRIANNQLGCEPEDLVTLVDALEDWGLPEWLHGTINTESAQAWQMYIRETLENLWGFFTKVNGIAIGICAVLALVEKVWQRKGKDQSHHGAKFRLSWVILTYALLMALTYHVINMIHSSPWGQGISSGQTYRRPFLSQESAWKEDPFITQGSTTFPSRFDVLVDTRYHSETLGAYARWPEFHPGNKVLRNHILSYPKDMYRSYEDGLPPIFSEWVINQTISTVSDSNGRFLQQDYRTGDWRLMSSSEIRSILRLDLISHASNSLLVLKKNINFLFGKYRYGARRATVLSKHMQFSLVHLSKLLFGGFPGAKISESRPKTSSLWSISSKLTTLPAIIGHVPLAKRCEKWRTFPESKSTPGALYVGQDVLVQTNDAKPALAAIHNLRDEYIVDVAYHGTPSYKYGAYGKGISTSSIVPVASPVEGSRVHADFRETGQWFSGTIARVHPSGCVDISFDDGDFESHVPRSRYVSAK